MGDAGGQVSQGGQFLLKDQLVARLEDLLIFLLEFLEGFFQFPGLGLYFLGLFAFLLQPGPLDLLLLPAPATHQLNMADGEQHADQQ